MTARRGRGGGRRGRKDKPASPAAFWGVAAGVPERRAMPESDDPTAVVRSLGPPPLPGHEAIAEHYFDAVYERAALLAGALAAAGGLIPIEDVQPSAG